MLVTSIFSFLHNVFLPFPKQISILGSPLFCPLWKVLILATSQKFCLMVKGWSISRYWANHHILFSLTHYQMTNFRLFQTERLCRRQFQIWRKWQKVIQMGKKHCGKRTNCLSWAICPFPTVLSKGLFPGGRQKASLYGNGLSLS